MARGSSVLIVLAACGGSHHTSSTPRAIGIEPNVAELSWYRAATTCAQGPFELAVDATNEKYGEDVELQLHTPRAVAIEAVVLADGVEVTRAHAVYDASGATSAKPANARCIADAHERLVLGRGGGGAGGSTGSTGGTLVVPPEQATVTARLERVTEMVPTSTSVIHLRVPPNGHRIVIKFWSIEPNDLLDVHFGVAHIVWRPNVPEAQYQAYLAAEIERDRQRQAELAARPPAPSRPRAVTVAVVVDPGVEEARRHAAEERARRAEIAAALEVERARRRDAFCAAHHDDRGCWGPGGYQLHVAFDEKRAVKAAYCAQHAEDARCWSDADWRVRRESWTKRVQVARTPVRPDGPPPAALAETPPPRLSEHAEWRPGYWQWTEGQWIWLAGQWRVPEADIVAETTTTAPAAPPPLQVEVTPVAPVRTAVWIGGFWQWGGSTGWVWIPGSWQLRPEPRVEWRAPEWRVRGAVHILVPGAWERR